MTVATVHVFDTGEGCLSIAGEAKSPVIVFTGEEINWNIVTRNNVLSRSMSIVTVALPTGQQLPGSMLVAAEYIQYSCPFSVQGFKFNYHCTD